MSLQIDNPVTANPSSVFFGTSNTQKVNISYTVEADLGNMLIREYSIDAGGSSVMFDNNSRSIIMPAISVNNISIDFSDDLNLVKTGTGLGPWFFIDVKVYYEGGLDKDFATVKLIV